jgi:hypothetical protein
MKKLFAFFLFSVCLSQHSAAQTETITVPVVDKTGAASPFQVSGGSVLQETLHGNELEWSWGQRVAIKNVSSKPIVLFVATLSEIGPHPRGLRAAPGDGSTYVLEDDRFFTENLIRPGESITLRDTEPGVPNVGCCIEPMVQKSDPTAQYYLHFVQFADGSVFGDPAEARDALALRETILLGLRELNNSYSERGEQGFTAKLKEESPFSATAPFKQILAQYSGSGVQAALDKARQILATAEEHAAMVARATSTLGN